jgi:uncharacterized OB-fold protein
LLLKALPLLRLPSGQSRLLLTNRQFLESAKSMGLPVPAITPESEPFWSGGAVGELRIMACGDCDLRIHPPQLICPRCLARNVAPVVASGTGTVHSFTINRQQWLPNLAVPYVLAIVDLDDQPGVRLTARVELDDPSRMAIGAPVAVDFEPREDVFVPFFRLR